MHTAEALSCGMCRMLHQGPRNGDDLDPLCVQVHASPGSRMKGQIKAAAA